MRHAPERKTISASSGNGRAFFANPCGAEALAPRHRTAMSAAEPFALFDKWFAEARAAEHDDPTAVALATTDPSGHPSVRMVLLKAVDPRGFVFYTNLNSPKAHDLQTRPRAALCIHWPRLERQVRIEGGTELVNDVEADAYFATRPRLSQLGAWASRQSQPMTDRFELEQAIAAATLRFHIGRVPRPPHWSGFRVLPDRFEFWQQRPFRHHDRQRFFWNGDGWRHQWLFP